MANAKQRASFTTHIQCSFSLPKAVAISRVILFEKLNWVIREIESKKGDSKQTRKITPVAKKMGVGDVLLRVARPLERRQPRQPPCKAFKLGIKCTFRNNKWFNSVSVWHYGLTGLYYFFKFLNLNSVRRSFRYHVVQTFQGEPALSFSLSLWSVSLLFLSPLLWVISPSN